MLAITIPAVTEFWDAEIEEFVTFEGFDLELEHSLASLSKWESLHEKPFLSKDEKTTEETASYVECMILSKNPPPDVFRRLSEENLKAIQEHIQAKMTATWFNELPASPHGQVITAELIYYWMVAFSIPFECQTWHLNRLLTLIKVCNAHNSPQKKRSAGEIAARNRQLNEERLKKYGTSG